MPAKKLNRPPPRDAEGNPIFDTDVEMSASLKYYYKNIDVIRAKMQAKKEERAAYNIVTRFYLRELPIKHSTVKKHLPAVQDYLFMWGCHDLAAELTAYANQTDAPRTYKITRPRFTIKTGPAAA